MVHCLYCIVDVIYPLCTQMVNCACVWCARWMPVVRLHVFLHYTEGHLVHPGGMLCGLTLYVCACLHVLAWRGSQYPSIAEEIKSVASADPALRKLFVRGLAWNTTSETLCAVSVCCLRDMHYVFHDFTLLYDYWSLTNFLILYPKFQCVFHLISYFCMQF